LTPFLPYSPAASGAPCPGGGTCNGAGVCVSAAVPAIPMLSHQGLASLAVLLAAAFFVALRRTHSRARQCADDVGAYYFGAF